MSWQAVDLASAGHDHERPGPTIAGIAYPGCRLLVSGEPESLKSWLAAVLAVEQVRAGNFVVWIDFEQGPAMTRARFADLGLTDEELAQVLYLEPREPLTNADRASLTQTLQHYRPTLVVFDAYSGLIGVYDFDPDSTRDIERINRRVVDVFRDCGATVAILDHVVKAKDNRSRYSSGSGRKLAEVEVHIGLERVKHFSRGGSGLARIRNHKDRLGGLNHPLVGELHLASDPDTGAVNWDIRPPTADTPAARETFRPTGLMERVSTYLELQTEPVSRRTIETNVRGKGEYVRLAIDTLVNDGHVTASPGARGAQLLESVRAYREADDLVPANPSNRAAA